MLMLELPNGLFFGLSVKENLEANPSTVMLRNRVSAV
jgi:hypothetical protein